MNLKKNVDEAITLFSNKEAIETILIEPLEKYLEYFNEQLKKLKEIANTPKSVD
jgi:type I restriction enzyme R subunit